MFVSNRVPDIEMFSWMPLLSMQSFVSAFSLPRRGLEVSARLYISCESDKDVASKPTLLSKSNVPSEYVEYTRIFGGLMERFAAVFNKVDIFCSSKLADALCHTAEANRPGSLVFLLEHDWLILPSEFQGSLLSIGRQLLRHRAEYEYVLLQRGDRQIRTTGSPTTGKGKLYSNNPFLANGAFLAKLKNQGLCTYNTSSWEKNVESYCKKGTRCKLAVLRPKQKSSLYHMDGRFLSFAANHSVGPLFDGSLFPEGSFSIIQQSPDHVISAIASMCASLPIQCDPYFLRHEFAVKIRDFANSHGLTRSAPSEFLVSKYVGSMHAAELYLEGQFPYEVLRA